MSKYAGEVNPWGGAVKDKWIIFDTNSIISIVKLEQRQVLDDLKSQAAGFAVIHPVQIELQNTNNPRERVAMRNLLAHYDFIELPLKSAHFKVADKIQELLPLSANASPADLYLGAVLSDHHDDRLVLTANIKDFPTPLYPRVGHVLLQSNSSVMTLTLVSIDKTLLSN